MMTTQFTPGPWIVEKRRPYIIQPSYPSFDCIANVQVSNVNNWDANARLIAAAPTLLAALMDAEVAMMRVEFVGASAMDGGIGAIDAALINIRAAIAKATKS